MDRVTHRTLAVQQTTRCSSERPLLFYVYISALSIFTPPGSTHRDAGGAASIPEERRQARLGPGIPLWMLKVHETYLTPQQQPDRQLLRVQNTFTV